MASRTQARTRFGRRILWLAAAIVVVCLAYTAAWYYVARTLEHRMATTLAELNGGGVRAHCEEPEARGYPFRVGLFCRSVFYENVRSGVSIRAGAFRSAANVYRPFHVLGEMDAPAAVVFPLLVPLQARWENLRASVRLADPLPERVSLEGKSVVIIEQEGSGAPLATLGDVQTHARQREADVEAAVSFRDLVLGDEIGADLPSLEGRALVRIEDGVALLESGQYEPYGRSAMIEDLSIGVVGESAGLSVSGPISVDGEGLIDAELSVVVSDPTATLRLMARIFPDASDHIMTASAALSSFGNEPLRLRIVRGRVMLGFIPLGSIPPV